MVKRFFGGVVLSTVAAIAVACGGGGSTPTAPSSGGNTGSTGQVGATITITPSGISNNSVAVSVGQSVTFVNNDTRSHNMESNPHPAHTDCPALNVGSIAAGGTATSAALTVARTCGYHDHNDASNSAWQGQVVIR